MEGAVNAAFDRDQHTQVSSVIMFSVTGFTYGKTKSKSICIHLSHCVI